jgi:hypothetical protein
VDDSTGCKSFVLVDETANGGFEASQRIRARRAEARKSKGGRGSLKKVSASE